MPAFLKKRDNILVLVFGVVLAFFIGRMLQMQLIQGDEWMDMLKVRNQLAHDYDGVIVKKYCHIIVDEYIGKFEEFQRKVDSLFYNI